MPSVTSKKALLVASLLGLSILPQAAFTLPWREPQAEGGMTAAKASQQAAARLQAHLRAYERLAENGGWPAFMPGTALEPGMRSARIGLARHILRATGDDVTPEEPADPDTYDAALQEAVLRFQSRHGLAADGVLGQKTQAALAVPVERRIAQMKAALERMREASIEAEKYILVNVPGYHLRAVENNETAFTSRVIVGSPENATPLFSNAITDISFNPSWTVPARIAAAEVAMKERNNPGYFSRAGFAVIDSEGSRVEPEEIDWESLPRGHFPYRLKQRPGSGNALGKIKFHIPNNEAIYLHSTSSPKLFAKDARALSHGCIRVERTRELARFALAGQDGWNAARVDEAYDSSRSRMVALDAPVPVYLVYWTAWVDEENRLNFRPDIYRHDAARVAELLEEERKNAGVRLAMR